MYIPDHNDPVDIEVARIVNANRDAYRIPILKVDRGYLVGTDIQLPVMKGNNCVVRVGGGYIKFEDYIQRHHGE